MPFVHVRHHGAIGNGVVDDTAAIQSAIDAAAGGPRIVRLGPLTYGISAALRIPSNVTLAGAGKRITKLRLLSGANKNLIEAANNVVVGAGIRDLTLDGNATGNARGGLWWDGANSMRGPCLTLERVLVTACGPIDGGPGAGEYGAVIIRGNTFGVMRDVDIIDNYKAVGLWFLAADWSIDGLYLGNNATDLIAAAGNATSYQMILQSGRANMFSNCYFGGNRPNGKSQIWIRGGRNNSFTGCVIDTSAEHGILMTDIGGVIPFANSFVGGQITNCSAKTHGTYHCIRIDQGHSNKFIGTSFFNDVYPNKPAHALFEGAASGANSLVGCSFDSSWTVGVDGRSATSGTVILASQGAGPGRVLKASKVIDPSSLSSPNGASTDTITVTGATLGDAVTSVSFSVDLQGVSLDAWVSAADTVTVRFQNDSGGAVDLASGTCRVQVTTK